MRGPCAKRQVRCVVIPLHHAPMVIGENSCDNAQAACPRLPGEGYEKCRDICQQHGHAEIEAVQHAERCGISLVGATATVFGHYWICEPCGRALREAGVKTVKVELSE